MSTSTVASLGSAGSSETSALVTAERIPVKWHPGQFTGQDAEAIGKKDRTAKVVSDRPNPAWLSGVHRETFHLEQVLNLPNAVTL